MHLELHAKWAEIKNCERFTRTYEREEGNVTYIDRAVIDWSKKTIYETYEEAKPKVYEDTDYLILYIKRVYGPYNTEASVKTALSRIKAEMRKKQFSGLSN